MGQEIVKTICFECHSRCGVLLEVHDGKITGIKGDKDHPYSKGNLCPKGKASIDIVYHPERITRPLLNRNKRGGGKFEPVSWEEALDVIAGRLLENRDKWGAESLAVGTGTTRGFAPFLHRFISLYGSPNYFAPAANMSGGPTATGCNMTMGFMLQPDYQSTKCMLLWAHNPESAWPGLYLNSIKEAIKNGAKVIVVDPRLIPIAKKADHWLRIRPGTDVALALGFLHVIIENQLYDKEFVNQWTKGFDQLRKHVAGWTPKRCAEITWLTAAEIEKAAVTFATTKPACISPGMAGTSQTPHAFDLNRALASIAAITGNLEVPGGNPNFVPVTGWNRHCYGTDFHPMNNLPPEQANKRIGMESFPVISYFVCLAELVWKAILEEKPYPVKAVGLFANNAVCAYANSHYVRKALSAVDFLFAVDFFHTPTTELADVILPAAHWSEKNDVEDNLMMNRIFCQAKAIEPVPECRDEKQIFIDLAKKMDLKGFWNTVEEGLDYRLEPIGIRFSELKDKGLFTIPVVYKSYETNKGFPTPSGSGKVDLYSELVEMSGGSSLPIYVEPPESPVSTPELHKKFPLILTTGGRNIAYFHTAHRNIPSLRKMSPDPQLDIHPETAASFKVNNGDWVRLVTPRGHVKIKVRFNPDIHPMVVHAPHGYWYGEKDGWERLNINAITDNQSQCPVSGSVPTRALLCKIKKK